MVTKGYGLTVHDIDWSCPADLEPYAKAHNLEVKENDAIIHAVCGSYVLSAVSVAVEHCLAGKKAKSQYIKQPILQEIHMKEEIPEEKRIEMENHKLAMSLRIMQANFEINRSIKNSIEK